MFYKILMISCFFTTVSYAKCDKLLATTVLVRHGERLGSYGGFDPNDPYLELRMENPSDQLLNLGIQELYNVGTWIRQHYAHFLSKKYNASEIFVQSINYDRCLMSAEALLSALYPPIEEEVWNPNILWQPVPIHSSPLKHDILLQWTACPYQTIQSEKALKLQKKIEKENSELFQFLTNNTGSEIILETTLIMYNILEGEKMLNLTLPLWAHGVIRDLKPLVEVNFIIQMMNKNLRKLRSGPLVHRILTQFTRAISGDNFGTTNDIYRKFMLYSTADMTEYFLADALSIFNIGVVNFGFSLYFELWQKDSGKHFVDIFFRNSTNVNATTHKAEIDGLGSTVSFDDFRKIAERVSMNSSQWKDLCTRLLSSDTSTKH